MLSVFLSCRLIGPAVILAHLKHEWVSLFTHCLYIGMLELIMHYRRSDGEYIKHINLGGPFYVL